MTIRPGNIDRSVWKRIKSIKLLSVPVRYRTSHACGLSAFIQSLLLREDFLKPTHIHNLPIIDFRWLELIQPLTLAHREECSHNKIQPPLHKFCSSATIFHSCSLLNICGEFYDKHVVVSYNN